MLYNELPIAFPWYDKIEQQNRYNENAQPVCDYKLISPRDALLPFQFARVNIVGALPTHWEIYDVNSNNLIVDISAFISLLDRRVLEGREYFTYYGQGLNGVSLTSGYYYSRMLFPDGTLNFSEMFHIPTDSFDIANDKNISYLKFVWFNKNDLRPIYYNNKLPDGTPKFKNVMYLDSFISASEPTIEEDDSRDGENEPIPTFQKVLIPYRISTATPDFLKKAIVLFPMHDVVSLTTQKGIRNGILKKLKINTALEANGALSIVDILFEETVIVKKGCGENMV